MTGVETISMDEVIDLLGQVTARDQRSTGEADVTTWWHDLNTARITYRDAQAAANHYYAVVWPAQKPQDRFRLTAPVVIELVRKAHAERLANFVYEPTPGETGAEFVERYDQQRDAVASGQVPPVPSITQALRPRPIAALVAGVAAARVLPPEIADVIAKRRPPGRSIRCPGCGAAPNAPCRTGSGRELKTVHPSRLDAWATADRPCPACGAAVNAPCREYGQIYRGGAHRERITGEPTPSAAEGDQP